jgi:ABC-type Fe3+-hydroxamate transport system substrate-binding protein
VIAVTEACLYPAEALACLPKIGRPQQPQLAVLQSLQPDLIIASREDNPPEVLAAVQATGLPVWATWATTVRAVLDLLAEIIRLGEVPQRQLQLVTLENACEWASLAAENMPPVKVFCPLGRAPDAPAAWTTFNQSTYPHDLLRLCGGENVFADHAARYPRVTLAEVIQRAPEVILLPSAPEGFTEADRSELLAHPEIPAGRDERIYFVEATLLTWAGTRLAKALAELPSLLQSGV